MASVSVRPGTASAQMLVPCRPEVCPRASPAPVGQASRHEDSSTVLSSDATDARTVEISQVLPILENILIFSDSIFRTDA